MSAFNTYILIVTWNNIADSHTLVGTFGKYGVIRFVIKNRCILRMDHQKTSTINQHIVAFLVH